MTLLLGTLGTAALVALGPGAIKAVVATATVAEAARIIFQLLGG